MDKKKQLRIMYGRKELISMPIPNDNKWKGLTLSFYYYFNEKDGKSAIDNVCLFDDFIINLAKPETFPAFMKRMLKKIIFWWKD